MTVNDLQALLPAGAAGVALGAIFFGGLLWTVRKVVSSPWPALWISYQPTELMTQRPIAEW